MDRELEATYIEALDALEAGEPLEAILERYPRQADQLRPLLETTVALSSVPVAYSAEARQASRDALLQRAADLRQRRRPAAAPWWRRFTLALGSLAVLLILLGGLLVGPAGSALPGDALYPVKVAGEGARLALAGGPASRGALRERFRRERVSEINALLALGREADVSCFGTLRAVEEDAWLLDDLRVQITAETAVEGQPRVGAEAEGTCRVANGQVTALTMRVEAAPDLRPQPTPSPTLEPTPTATGTPEPSATPSPTLTATPTPSPTETMAPPPAPAGDQDRDDNGDQDRDDNGDDDRDDDEDDDHDDDGDENGDDDDGQDDGDDGDDGDDDGNDDEGDDDGDNSGSGSDDDDEDQDREEDEVDD